MTRPSLLKQHGEYLSKRDGGFKCRYCGQPLDREGVDLYLSPTIDHVIPLHRGGSNQLSNLVLACRFCNSSKSDKTYAEWIERKAYLKAAKEGK